MEGLFGIVGIGCGLYCLYGYYLLKFKGEISSSILLPKDVNPKKCKDFRGYCQEAQWPLLILGIIATLYGAVDLYNVYVGGVDLLFLIMMGLLFVALVIYVILIRKINRKYFGI
ncbi:MAG TPA: hypothetical protein H9873_02795 [Candidatus Dorea gallistercoris]|uniref:DUF3784 domain-containing protein n=1 Tax=Candidatus Dorea gallistercoris TaxID=2838542 RepID=A0A9D1UE75_9FIRM|nr:hypothetical protein [Candidatus Dorea gallistercoris]